MPSVSAAAAIAGALPLGDPLLPAHAIAAAAAPAPITVIAVACAPPPCWAMTNGPATPTILFVASMISTLYRPGVAPRNTYSPVVLVLVVATKRAVSRLRRRTR